MTDSQSKAWCFTIANPTADDKPDVWFSDGKVTYVVWQMEMGDGGLVHYQGYVECVARKRLAWLKKNLHSTAHWEPRKGNQEQAISYCKKDDTRMAAGGPWEAGEAAEKKQGERSDLKKVADMVAAGASMQQVAEEHGSTYIQYSRGIMALKQQLTPAYGHDDVRGIWYYGPPRTGKSRKARDENPEAFIKSQNKWWDGYEGQEVVILEDFDEMGACLSHKLKTWTDRYPDRGEVKGSTINLAHKKFIITSNYTPEEIWPTQPVLVEAIRARFTFTYFPKMKESDDTSPKKIKSATPTIPVLKRKADDADLQGGQRLKIYAAGFNPGQQSVGFDPKKGGSKQESYVTA